MIGARVGYSKQHCEDKFHLQNMSTISSPAIKEKTSNFVKYYDTHIKALL